MNYLSKSAREISFLGDIAWRLLMRRILQPWIFFVVDGWWRVCFTVRKSFVTRTLSIDLREAAPRTTKRIVFPKANPDTVRKTLLVFIIMQFLRPRGSFNAVRWLKMSDAVTSCHSSSPSERNRGGNLPWPLTSAMHRRCRILNYPKTTMDFLCSAGSFPPFGTLGWVEIMHEEGFIVSAIWIH